MTRRLSLTFSLLLATVASARTPATTQAVRDLPGGPWASTWFGGKSDDASPTCMVDPWLDPRTCTDRIIAYATAQRAAGRPVVLTLNEPQQRPLRDWATWDEVDAGWTDTAATLAARGVRLDLLSLDVETTDTTTLPLVRRHVVDPIAAKLGGRWANYWTSVLPPAAVVAPKGAKLAPVLRRFGASDYPDDEQPSQGQTCNSPVCNLNTGNAASAKSPVGRLAQDLNRIVAALKAEPNTPVVPWVAGLREADPGVTRAESRALYAHLMALVGGRVLMFDESGPDFPTAGSDVVADYETVAHQWVTLLAGRKWVRATRLDYHAVGASYVITWCDLDDGSRACVVTGRKAWHEPLPVAKDRDGFVCVVPAPADGLTAMTVFRRAG